MKKTCRFIAGCVHFYIETVCDTNQFKKGRNQVSTLLHSWIHNKGPVSCLQISCIFTKALFHALFYLPILRAVETAEEILKFNSYNLIVKLHYMFLDGALIIYT